MDSLIQTASACLFSIFGKIAILLFIGYWTFKQYKASKKAAVRAKFRKHWDSRPKDVVTLHSTPRAMTCPNVGPYSIKLELYFRMQGIQYEMDFENWHSYKGKSPWITVNGVDVADSQLSLEYLTKHLGKDMDGHLTSEQKAQARGIRIMLEEHYYWVGTVLCWLFHEAKETVLFYPPTFFATWLPKWLALYLHRNLGKKVFRASAMAHGMGRHEEEEVAKFGTDTMSACNDMLEGKPFLFGDKPSSADLALFGMVCMTTRLPENTVSQLKHHIDKHCPNILRFHKNIVDLYWPDYMTEARWQPGQLQQKFYEPFNTKANFFK